MPETERRFPIQQEYVSGKGYNRGGSIPWSVAERVYADYSLRCGGMQSLERLAECGGFELSEVRNHLGLAMSTDPIEGYEENPR